MKLLFFFLLINFFCFSQNMKQIDYDFSIKTVYDSYNKDTSKIFYDLIKLRPELKKIIITYKYHDPEEYIIKEKWSTYSNNRMYYTIYNNIWYKFTFIKLNNFQFYLNIESIDLNIDLVFILKN